MDVIKLDYQFPTAEPTGTSYRFEPGHIYMNGDGAAFDSFGFFFKCDLKERVVTDELVLVAIRSQSTLGTDETTYSQDKFDKDYFRVMEIETSLIAQRSRLKVTKVYLAVLTNYKSTVNDVPTNAGILQQETIASFLPKDMFSQSLLRLGLRQEDKKTKQITYRMMRKDNIV